MGSNQSSNRPVTKNTESKIQIPRSGRSSDKFSSIAYNGYIAFRNQESFELLAEDVWVDLCIQFSIYITKRADKYRKLVPFEGKKVLETQQKSIEGMISDFYDQVNKTCEAGKYFLPDTFSYDHTLVLKLCTMKGVSNYFTYTANSISKEKQGGWSSFKTSSKDEWDRLLGWLKVMVEMIDEPKIDDWYGEFEKMINQLEDEEYLKLACSDKSGEYHPKYLYGWLKLLLPFNEHFDTDSPIRSFVEVGVKNPSGNQSLFGGISFDNKPIYFM